MTTLVFLDAETTSLRPDRRAWEIAFILRKPDQPDEEHTWFIDERDLDLAGADLGSLRIGQFHDRHPGYGDTTSDTISERDALELLEADTRGATIVGAVPNFDTEVLGNRMRAQGLCPSWHYHLVDVETLAAGRLRLQPPWDFDYLLDAFELKYNEADRHTALGDARMVRDLYDAVYGGREATA